MDESELSHWGWGLRERFSSRDDRRDLADLVEGVLGFPEREVREQEAADGDAERRERAQVDTQAVPEGGHTTRCEGVRGSGPGGDHDEAE